MAFVTDKEELKPGLVIFRRGDLQTRDWYCRVRLPKATRYKTIALKTPDITTARTLFLSLSRHSHVLRCFNRRGLHVHLPQYLMDLNISTRTTSDCQSELEWMVGLRPPWRSHSIRTVALAQQAWGFAVRAPFARLGISGTEVHGDLRWGAGGL